MTPDPNSTKAIDTAGDGHVAAKIEGGADRALPLDASKTDVPCPENRSKEHERVVKPDVAEPNVSPNMAGAEQQVGRVVQTETRKVEPFALNHGSDNETYPPDKLEKEYGNTLVGDMNDAELLVSYATRNGIGENKKLTAEIVQSLISARQRFRRGAFVPENEETSFRTNYGLLAQAVAPVTVASLRDSLPNGQTRRWHLFFESEPRSNAERACFKYRDAAMVALVALLVSQVYWTIITSLLTKVKVPGISLELPNGLALAASNTLTNTEQSDAAERTKKTEAMVQESRISMLRTWMRPFLNSNATGALIRVGAPEQKMANGLNYSGPPPYISVCVIAEQVIGVMQAWWLPLLYGALGAMVYVIRTLSLQARDRLFRKEGLIALNMRIYLGMIAGLGIGWFWKDSSAPQSVATAVSPFALAFVAGYGVELFFVLLDKIVTTFTNRSES